MRIGIVCQSLSTIRLSRTTPRTRTRPVSYMKNQNHKNVGDQQGAMPMKNRSGPTPHLRRFYCTVPWLAPGNTRPRAALALAAAMLRSSTAEGGAVAAPPGAQLAASGGCGGRAARSLWQFSFWGWSVLAVSRTAERAGWLAAWGRGHTSRALGCEHGSATRLISQTLIHMDVLSNNKPFCPD